MYSHVTRCQELNVKLKYSSVVLFADYRLFLKSKPYVCHYLNSNWEEWHIYAISLQMSNTVLYDNYYADGKTKIEFVVKIFHLLVSF